MASFGAASTFVYEQVSPSDTWTVVHNLNVKAPIVDTWLEIDGQIVKVMPERVEFVDLSTCRIHFTSPQIGRAVVA